MKRFVTIFIFALCFHTVCLSTCLEEIKTFYTAYLTKVLHDDSKNETLCRTYLTDGLAAKVQRMRNATGADPIIRAQDVNTDAIETIAVKQLAKDWYLVSYLWNKEDSTTLTEIPLKAQNIGGKCKITYITPIANGSQYGDEWLSCCEDKQANKINQGSAESFLESFYKAYVATYCCMDKNISVPLSSLRLNNLSQKALEQFKNAESENLKDGLSGYDLLIDNFDFDCMWCKSLRISRLKDNDFQIAYQAGNKTYKIDVTITSLNNRYLIDRISY